MKLIKMLGLAVVSVIAAMAFVGVSSASADLFCLDKTVAETCPAGKTAPNGTEFKGELKEGKVVIKGGLNIDCTSSFVIGNITGTGGTVHGRITSITFENCTNCSEVTAKDLNNYPTQWDVQSDWTGIIGGIAQSTWVVSHPVIEMQKCPLTIQCTMTVTSASLDMESTGASQTLKAVNEEFSLGICGKGTLSATYKITSPLPSFVSLK